MSSRWPRGPLVGSKKTLLVAVASKFFVTGVKDLSTGVKYMDSKVDFWFYSYRGRGAKCVEVLCVEGGGEGGKMCGSTMRRRRGGGGKMCRSTMCRSTMRRNLHKLTKVFNDVLSKYLKNGLGDLHKTL